MEEMNQRHADLEADLRDKVDDLGRQIELMKTIDAENTERIFELKNGKGEKMGSVDEQDSMIDDVCQQYENVPDEPPEALGCGHNFNTRKDSIQVSFTVYLDHLLDNTAKNGSKIVYNSILLNVGKGYDTKTGVFTAPVSGVYLFSWSWSVGTGDHLISPTWQGLVVDGNSQVGTVSHTARTDDEKVISGTETGSNDNDLQSSSTTVVLRLSEGDRVWTQIPGQLREETVKGFATFTGTILYSDVEN